MKNSILFLLFLGISVKVFAQGGTYIEEVNGRPIRKGEEVSIDGTPYLFDAWKEAVVEMKNGKSYHQVPVNINLIREEVVFAGKDGEVLGFTDEVVSMAIVDGERKRFFKRDFPKAKGVKESDYLEVLADGTKTLLKKWWKVLWEEKSYNSATKEQHVLDKSAYFYLDKDRNILIPFKVNKKSVLELLADHQVEILQYAEKEHIQWENDVDLAKLFNYYNSI